MRYNNIVEGIFKSRPNRFVARVEINGEEISVHVKNTGRCRELLTENARVFLEDFSARMGSRKLRYSLIGVMKGNMMVNMDSQAPNKVVKEALEEGSFSLPQMGKITLVKSEAKYGNSRLDFYVKDENGREGYIEVKGVTLEDKGVASFPDAPTERGIKHLNELMGLKEQGFLVYCLFVIQMENMRVFKPDIDRHKEFADTLKTAKEKGVQVLAYTCRVTKDTLRLDNPVKVEI